MNELTGKQKRFLRGLGRQMRATGTIGKASLSEPIIAAVGNLLEHHELVKIRISPNLADDRRELAAELAKSTNSICVSVLGRTALLYRSNESLESDKRIHLP